MKTGIGATNVDKEINLSTRGLINAMSVETVDKNGNIITPITVSSSGGVGRAIAGGSQAPQQLSVTSVPCQRVVIYNYSSNANFIAIGLSNAVVAEDGTKIGKGEQMTGLAVTTIYTTDLMNVWWAAVAVGDGLSYSYYV